MGWCGLTIFQIIGILREDKNIFLTIASDIFTRVTALQNKYEPEKGRKILKNMLKNLDPLLKIWSLLLQIFTALPIYGSP